MSPAVAHMGSGLCVRLLAGILCWPLLPLHAGTDADEIPPLRPPRAELPPTFWEQHGTALALGLLVLLVGAAVGAWFLLRKRAAVSPDPAEQARSALAAVHSMPQDGRVLSRVSNVVKRYLSSTFGLPQREMTTSEFIHELQRGDRIGKDIAERASGLLMEWDRAKFAPAESRARNGTQAAPENAVTSATALVELSETRLSELRLQEEQAAREAATKQQNLQKQS